MHGCSTLCVVISQKTPRCGASKTLALAAPRTKILTARVEMEKNWGDPQSILNELDRNGLTDRSDH